MLPLRSTSAVAVVARPGSAVEVRKERTGIGPCGSQPMPVTCTAVPGPPLVGLAVAVGGPRMVTSVVPASAPNGPVPGNGVLSGWSTAIVVAPATRPDGTTA